VTVIVAAPVAVTEPLSSLNASEPVADDADRVPVIAMFPDEDSVPDSSVPMMFVAVVKDDALPVTVKPPRPAVTTEVEPMATPVPELPPTVADPVIETLPLVPD
jgi:hypothetical protein